MFDLDEALSSSGKPTSGFSPPSRIPDQGDKPVSGSVVEDQAARPKSREERLRDFYAKHQAADKDEVQASHAVDAATVREPSAPKTREERLREFYASRQDERQTLNKVQDGQKVLSKAREPTVQEQEEALRLKKQGNDIYAAGDFESAVEHYSTAIKKAPSSVLYSNRAAAYMMLGWWDQALRDTKAATRKDAANEKALERHGKCLIMTDKLDDACKVVTDMVDKIPQDERQKMKKLPVNIRRFQWLCDNARDPSSLEQVRTVLNEFTSTELVSPLGMRLRKRLSKCLVERADALDNQRKIRPAMAKNRQTGEEQDEISEITPFAEEAIRVTGELLEDNPDDAELRYWRGRALVRLGRHDDAEVQLKRGLQNDPEHLAMKNLVETMTTLDELKVRGNSYYKEGRINEAIQAYTEGIEKDPECQDTLTVSTLYYNRSAAYRKKGEFQRALQDANTSLALHPKWAKALYRRGILLLECERPAEALTELKTVQRADPTFDEDLETWLRRAHNWLSKKADEKNYYKFMGIPMDSSREEIRKQYHKLCLLWHPDKNPTEEGRARFDELREAYAFLMDEDQKEQYDFGIWKEKSVRHHAKFREKVKNTWDDLAAQELHPREVPAGWGDKHLEEDDKVEHIAWGGRGAPAWLQERRKQVRKMRYGADASDSD